MSTAENREEIIILSDDEEEDGESAAADDDNDLSCQIVEKEDVCEGEVILSQSVLEEQDLVVTFSRRAEVLPHARYDCPIHPFEATEQEKEAPVANNQLFCDQCFCYICDKLASLCTQWRHPGDCHCNGHKKSKFWNNIRNFSLLGRLKNFNLDLSDLDSHLRLAETMLQSFRRELCTLFTDFLKGRRLRVNGVNQQGIVHDYKYVFEFVSSFLNKADQQESRAAVILHLGAAEDFIRHHSTSGYTDWEQTSNPVSAKVLLLRRVVSSVERLMVTADFSSDFISKLQTFCHRLFFPVEIKSLKRRLYVRPWDDILLVSVLKGQNVVGMRKDKRKKDVLVEPISVVHLRTVVLQQRHRYRDLCRYLRVVKTDDSMGLQRLQDLIPYFLCAAGDLSGAMKNLFTRANPPASRLTPPSFLTYLRIFETATVPKLTVTEMSDLCSYGDTFEPIQDATPLKRAELVKFALLAKRSSPPIYADSQCWTAILTIVNRPPSSHPALPAPPPEFLQRARDVVNNILCNHLSLNMQFPRDFQQLFPEQALLLLVTGALTWRIHHMCLYPIVPVLNTFKNNVWAITWLYDGLSRNAERFSLFLKDVNQELENPAGYSSLSESLLWTHGFFWESTMRSARGSPQCNNHLSLPDLMNVH